MAEGADDVERIGEEEQREGEDGREGQQGERLPVTLFGFARFFR